MTQEDKNLLLKDLCARLPYGVKLYIKDIEKGESNVLTGVSVRSGLIETFSNEYYIEDCKLYLRPMSSITEEEKKELKSSTCPFGTGYFDEKYLICPMNHFGEQISYEFMSEILDWVNARHFDYRGLIERGLALEAPEGMYKTK